MNDSNHHHMTEAELRDGITRLEAEAGKSAAQLRAAKKTYYITRKEAQILHEIRNHEFILGEGGRV